MANQYQEPSEELLYSIFQNYERLGSKKAVARVLGIPETTIRRWLKKYMSKVSCSKEDIMSYSNSEDDVPLSEVAIPKLHEGSKEETLADLRAMAEANPEQVISRNYYRVHGKYSESAWSRFWGTFHEFKRQAGIVLSRQQHNLEKHIAKHASVDHYRALNSERRSYGNKYDKPKNGRFKQVVVLGDLHDKNVDPFFMEVLLETLKRIKPDIIVLNGDIFDLAEFSRYTVDPRDWDVVGRIKYSHDNIIKPIREACPDSQIDFIEGNHEYRLLKHLADATPALRAVLSDLHGFTVSSLLGLDKFKINYIAKGDLATYTLADTHKQITKNYKIYYDSFIVCHDNSAKSLGYPGINGHNHKTVVDSMYNEHFGAYNWIQHGCGHKLDAEYCHSKWQQGFVIATCDTLKRKTVFDIVTFAEDFAVVGGVYYDRS